MRSSAPADKQNTLRKLLIDVDKHSPDPSSLLDQLELVLRAKKWMNDRLDCYRPDQVLPADFEENRYFFEHLRGNIDIADILVANLEARAIMSPFKDYYQRAYLQRILFQFPSLEHRARIRKLLFDNDSKLDYHNCEILLANSPKADQLSVKFLLDTYNSPNLLRRRFNQIIQEPAQRQRLLTEMRTKLAAVLPNVFSRMFTRFTHFFSGNLGREQGNIQNIQEIIKSINKILKNSATIKAATEQQLRDIQSAILNTAVDRYNVEGNANVLNDKLFSGLLSALDGLDRFVVDQYSLGYVMQEILPSIRDRVLNIRLAAQPVAPIESVQFAPVVERPGLPAVREIIPSNFLESINLSEVKKLKKLIETRPYLEVLLDKNQCDFKTEKERLNLRKALREALRDEDSESILFDEMQQAVKRIHPTKLVLNNFIHIMLAFQKKEYRDVLRDELFKPVNMAQYVKRYDTDSLEYAAYYSEPTPENSLLLCEILIERCAKQHHLQHIYSWNIKGHSFNPPPPPVYGEMNFNSLFTQLTETIKLSSPSWFAALFDRTGKAQKLKDLLALVKTIANGNKDQQKEGLYDIMVKLIETIEFIYPFEKYSEKMSSTMRNLLSVLGFANWIPDRIPLEMVIRNLPTLKEKFRRAKPGAMYVPIAAPDYENSILHPVEDKAPAAQVTTVLSYENKVAEEPSIDVSDEIQVETRELPSLPVTGVQEDETQKLMRDIHAFLPAEPSHSLVTNASPSAPLLNEQEEQVALEDQTKQHDKVESDKENQDQPVMLKLQTKEMSVKPKEQDDDGRKKVDVHTPRRTVKSGFFSEPPRELLSALSEAPSVPSSKPSYVLFDDEEVSGEPRKRVSVLR